MRPTEVEGKDYFFISPAEFESWVKQDAFLEHAVVFENRYGTPKGPVENVKRSAPGAMCCSTSTGRVRSR